MSPGHKILLLLSAILVVNCARSFNPDVKRGSSYNFKRGYPEVRLSALNSWDKQQQSNLKITADIVYGSLSFRKSGQGFRANLAVELLVEESSTDSTVYSSRFSYDQTVDSYEKTNSQDVFRYQKILDVEPGSYEITFTLIDQTTGKRNTVSNRAIIQESGSKKSFFTDVELFGKNLAHEDPSWFPITTYDVPQKIDSLRFKFQVNNKEEDNLAINTSLVRFKADTTAARPMYLPNYSSSSIAYKGIDYDEEETIQSTKRILSQKGIVTVELKIPIPSRGNYQFRVNSDDDEKELFKARDFGVKSTNYPTIKTPQELAEPLVYLMSDDEYEDLMEIEDPDSLKQTVDRFWLREIGDRNKAKSVISLYYERVETANKMFSNFKAGWKTDRGMVFILFGTPISTQKEHDKLTWSYSYDRTNPNENFTFEVNRFKSEYFPFEHYILDRNNFYFQEEYQQKQLWLSGLIITMKR